MKDVWDAEMLTGNYEPTTAINIAFSLCTDGVQIFKSSKVTMWPVYLAILNLPPSKRFKSQNVILSSLWVGPSKPPMNHLLEPLTQRISQLSSTGVTIQVGSGYATVKAKLSLAVFDLPAKAAVLNCKQFMAVLYVLILEYNKADVEFTCQENIICVPMSQLFV